MNETVAVTGVGIVSPLGVADAFWRALCAGESGIAPRESSGAAKSTATVAAEVRDFDPRAIIGPMHLRRMDKLSRMIVAASRMALADTGLAPEQLAPDSIGVVVGSAIGDVAETEVFLDRVFTKGPAGASPMIFPNLVLNAPAGYVSMETGALGVNFTVAQGETSGEQAIALGCDLIRGGRADIVLAGGGDELADILFTIYGQGKTLSGQRGGNEWSSPYDSERNGVVLGEGAAMLALESPERARARGARVFAEIADCAIFHVAAPPYDWPERVEPPARLRELVADRRIDLVCGGANSSRRLDTCEIDLVMRLLGERAALATLTSIKGAVGEFGAAGALTTAAACLALHEQTIPPLCNLQRPARADQLRFAPREGLSQRVDSALVLGLARGGAGAALLLRRAA